MRSPATAMSPAWRASLLVFGLLCPLVVFAALGEDQSSIDAESVQLHSSRLATAMQGYSVVEMQTPQQVRIRQFVSPAGVVFAVAWRGPFKPDLQLLLGRQFDNYRLARRDASPRRGVQVIQQPDLVVQSGGRQRSFFGIAYLPGLVPAGVAVGSLQ